MLARMTGEQLQLLHRAVEAYWSNEDGQPKHDFYFSTGMGARTGLQHPALGDEEIAVDVGDIEELANHGLLNVNWRGDLSGSFRPTAEGKQVVEDHRHIQEIVRADRAMSEGGGPGIGWEQTLPILQTIIYLYDEAGPGEDVSQPQVCQKLGRSENDTGVSRAFEVLETSGYVRAGMEIDSLPGLLTVTPTEKALQLLAGWPTSGDAAAQKLLSILDERIDQAPDEEKGKLRALRDSFVDIGEGVVAEVLVKLMTG
jgi:hypothetical protein